MEQGLVAENGKDVQADKGEYTLLRGGSDGYLLESHLHAISCDQPLPCFGCGIGWFSFLLGFLFPLLWFYATFLYFMNYSRKHPRERLGLAACAIAALICSVTALVVVLALLL